MFRCLLSFVVCLSVGTLHAGGYYRSYGCNTCYVKPVVYTQPYVAPRLVPVYNTVNYTYNLSQLPAPQGNVVANAVYSGDSYAGTDLAGVAIAQAQFNAQGLRSIDNGWATLREGNSGLTAFMMQAEQGNTNLALTRAKSFGVANALLANGQAVTQSLNAANAPASGAYSYQSSNGQQQYDQQQPPAPPSGPIYRSNPNDAQKIAAAEQRCTLCHANAQIAATKGGDVVLPKFSDLTPQQAQTVKDRVVSHNPELVMPKGQPLPDDELKALLGLLDSKIFSGR